MSGALGDRDEAAFFDDLENLDENDDEHGTPRTQTPCAGDDDYGCDIGHQGG